MKCLTLTQDQVDYLYKLVGYTTDSIDEALGADFETSEGLYCLLLENASKHVVDYYENVITITTL